MQATVVDGSDRQERALARRITGMFRRERVDDVDLLREVQEVVPLDASYEPAHLPAVQHLCGALLRELDITSDKAIVVLAASRIHDLGRARLPNRLAGLAGGLAADTVLSDSRGEIARRYPEFARGLQMIRSHHERWDGRGMWRQAGEDIPLGARVIAVADAYLTLTNDRPYRRALSPDRALRALREDRGRRWDPQVVSALHRVVGNQTI